MSLKFAMIGAAGFIAPRHLEAIQHVGGELVVAFDVNDSVGILDRYFPNCRFFHEFEFFEAHLGKLRRTPQAVDYVSICSPNYLHSAHIACALRNGAHAICEKPLVLTVGELDELKQEESRLDRRVFTVLQLRQHDAIRALREKVAASPGTKKFNIDLSYITCRGNWYHESWKGDVRKSGGLTTNIGIHFFDMLTWIFGGAEKIELTMRSPGTESGRLVLERAEVNWFLSVDRERLPEAVARAGKTAFRSLKINGEEFEFSEGFTDLHKGIYAGVLQGNGYSLDEARPAVAICEELRKLRV